MSALKPMGLREQNRVLRIALREMRRGLSTWRTKAKEATADAVALNVKLVDAQAQLEALKRPQLHFPPHPASGTLDLKGHRTEVLP